MPHPGAGYNYGPPVKQEGSGNPQETTGEVVDQPGASPHEPPPDATTVTGVVGSPSEESQVSATPEPVAPTDKEDSDGA